MSAPPILNWGEVTRAVPEVKSDIAHLVGWLQQSVMEREPVTTTKPGWSSETRRAAARLAATNDQHPPALLDSLRHFSITFGERTKKDPYAFVFLSAIARPEKRTGEETLTDLRRSISDEEELRLLRFAQKTAKSDQEPTEPDQEPTEPDLEPTEPDLEPAKHYWLATYRSSAGLHLLCPASGLWNLGLAEAQNNLRRHMVKHYHDKPSTHCDCFIVPMPTLVHTTWIGPPNPERKTVGGRQLELRADIDGPQLMAEAAAMSDRASQAEGWTKKSRPHRVIFHCLQEQKKEFDTEFEGTEVRVWAIEDQVTLTTTEDQVGWSKDKMPDTVGRIIGESIRLQKGAATRRDAVNAKNVWSMYTIWRYGGYHMDTGVYPSGAEGGAARAPKLPDRSQVKLPEPDVFAAPYTGRDNRVMKLRIRDFPKGGPSSIAVMEDHPALAEALSPPGTPPGQFIPKSLGDLAVDARKTSQYIKWGGDIWLVRSQQNNAGLLTALQVYAELWFKIQRIRATGFWGETADPKEVIYQMACRFVVMSAFANALVPRDTNQFWQSGSLEKIFEGHKIPMDPKPGGGILQDLAVEKAFFKSHGA